MDAALEAKHEARVAKAAVEKEAARNAARDKEIIR